MQMVLKMKETPKMRKFVHLAVKFFKPFHSKIKTTMLYILLCSSFALQVSIPFLILECRSDWKGGGHTIIIQNFRKVENVGYIGKNSIFSLFLLVTPLLNCLVLWIVVSPPYLFLSWQPFWSFPRSTCSCQLLTWILCRHRQLSLGSLNTPSGRFLSTRAPSCLKKASSVLVTVLQSCLFANLSNRFHKCSNWSSTELFCLFVIYLAR